MGEAAFDYRFGALDGEDNPLIEAYNNFPYVVKTLHAFLTYQSIPRALLFASPSKWDVFVQAMTGYFPMLVLEWYYDYFPGRRFRLLVTTARLLRKYQRI